MHSSRTLLRSLGGSLVAALLVTGCTDLSGSTGPTAAGRTAATTGAALSGGSRTGSVSGGGGSSTGGGTTTAQGDAIKINKHSYDAPSHELLVSASSSDGTAHLYLYAASGAYIGEVQNGGGGQYGGNVFISLDDPITITIKSSSGGTASIATVPFVP